MRSKESRIELMAPAGSWVALQAAIDSGVDSICFAVDQLNRIAKGSSNFTLDNLVEIVEHCQALNVKTYLRLNTIIHDHDLSIIKPVINKVKETEISSVITADQAVIQYAYPRGVDVHISTQVNTTKAETVKFYSMSPKHLCAIGFLDQMIDSGVDMLKIEGRGRAPEYLSTVICADREAMDSYYKGTSSVDKVKEWTGRLEKGYNRGLWGGYLLGQKMTKWTEGHGSQVTQEKLFLGRLGHYYTKVGVGQIPMEA